MHPSISIRLAPMIDILGHATQHFMHQFMINLWSLEARTCFTGLLSLRWTQPQNFGQLIKSG